MNITDFTFIYSGKGTHILNIHIKEQGTNLSKYSYLGLFYQAGHYFYHAKNQPILRTRSYFSKH